MSATAKTSRPAANDAKQADDGGQWGIKAFAQMFDVTPRTIRFYEDKGLLNPRREGQNRVFGLRDKVRFEKIMRGKRLGFSLDDIGAVMDVTDGVVTDRDELLRRKSNFEAVLATLARRRNDLFILYKDMREVIDIADDYLKTSDNNNDVKALAERYQAALDATLHSNPSDFMSGDPSVDWDAPLITQTAKG